MQSPKISCHSQFQPLQEVWIGGTYPEKFYSHFDSKSQDIFGRITEITSKDFDRLATAIENLGVNVIRPQFDKVDDYLDHQDRLLKPPISPCDFALALGQTLYIIPQYESGIDPYQHAIDQYVAAGQDVHKVNRDGSDPWAWIVFASVVRAGQDLLIDYDPKHEFCSTAAMAVAEALQDRYRVHLSRTGDHNDGVFCPIRPGVIFTSHYRKVYDQSFPGWSVFSIPNTLHKNLQVLNTHSKWYLPGIDHGHFNDMIIRCAEKWLGHPWETVFEVNMLVIDLNNVICGAYDEHVFKEFERLSITPHLVDFESRFFWDAGIHCLTSDIHRLGSKEDYWPGRGPNGIFQITEWL